MELFLGLGFEYVVDFSRIESDEWIVVYMEFEIILLVVVISGFNVVFGKDDKG